jgi:hypothetical protein
MKESELVTFVLGRHLCHLRKFYTSAVESKKKFDYRRSLRKAEQILRVSCI